MNFRSDFVFSRAQARSAPRAHVRGLLCVPQSSKERLRRSRTESSGAAPAIEELAGEARQVRPAGPHADKYQPGSDFSRAKRSGGRQALQLLSNCFLQRPNIPLLQSGSPEVQNSSKSISSPATDRSFLKTGRNACLRLSYACDLLFYISDKSAQNDNIGDQSETESQHPDTADSAPHCQLFYRSMGNDSVPFRIPAKQIVYPPEKARCR